MGEYSVPVLPFCCVNLFDYNASASGICLNVLSFSEIQVLPINIVFGFLAALIVVEDLVSSYSNYFIKTQTVNNKEDQSPEEISFYVQWVRAYMHACILFSIMRIACSLAHKNDPLPLSLVWPSQVINCLEYH